MDLEAPFRAGSACEVVDSHAGLQRADDDRGGRPGGVRNLVSVRGRVDQSSTTAVSTEPARSSMQASRTRARRVILKSPGQSRGKGAALRSAAGAVQRGTHIIPVRRGPGVFAAGSAPSAQDRHPRSLRRRLRDAPLRRQPVVPVLPAREGQPSADAWPPTCCSIRILSDLHTCLKLLSARAVPQAGSAARRGSDSIPRSRRSCFAMGVRPFEVPVSYHSRSPAAREEAHLA